MKRTYADIPEGQIFYRTEGEGEPVLLLHAGVTSSDEYKKVIPFLSKTCGPLLLIFWVTAIPTRLPMLSYETRKMNKTEYQSTNAPADGALYGPVSASGKRQCGTARWREDRN